MNYGKEKEKLGSLVDLYQFLRNREVRNLKNPYTHISIGEPYGKFNITKEDEDIFLELYFKALGNDLYLMEKKKEFDSLDFDIDFIFEGFKFGKRKYNEEDIKLLIEIINKEILKIYDYGDNEDILTSFVLEKSEPTMIGLGLRVKDGFHIRYPYIKFDQKVRKELFKKIKKKIMEENIFKNVPFTNNIDDVLDDYVALNGSMMYGSKKNKKSLYKLTHIYTYSMKEIDINKFSDKDIILILSGKNYISITGNNIDHKNENKHEDDIILNINI